MNENISHENHIQPYHDMTGELLDCIVNSSLTPQVRKLLH